MEKMRASVISSMAEQMGKTENELCLEISNAIDIAYADKNTQSEWMKLFGDVKPTPEEFIMTIANYITGGSGINQK